MNIFAINHIEIGWKIKKIKFWTPPHFGPSYVKNSYTCSCIGFVKKFSMDESTRTKFIAQKLLYLQTDNDHRSST